MESRLTGMSMDLEQAQKKKLQAVFPECFADGELDVEKLLSLCGAPAANRSEKYEFSWNGKAACLRLAQKRSTATLRPRPDESVDWDTTQNLYLEGDNLEVLRLLQSAYYGAIQVIYIDPPYNTGHDFVYADSFSDPVARYKEITEQTTKSNPETMGRYHTNWLNMMYPRLRLAHNLLKKEGVLFISIDENEQANLRRLCDEVFGEENFICQFVWINNERGRSIDKFISNTCEYIYLYAKNASHLSVNSKVESGEAVLREYAQRDAHSFYKKGDPLFNNNSKFNIQTRPNLVYAIYVNRHTNETRCIDEKQRAEDGSWYLPQENALGEDWIKIVPPIRKTNNLMGCWRWSMQKFNEESAQNLLLIRENSGKYMFYSKNRLSEDGDKRLKYKNVISGITSASGTHELVHILEGKYFDHPKPKALVKLLLEMVYSPNKDDIILDFFSGSATTAHAVMQLNSEDGGRRRFIMVQLPEPCDKNSAAFKAGYANICEIGKERLRRAGAEILRKATLAASQPTFEGLQKPLPDVGFKVFSLDSSNLKTWDPAFQESDDMHALENRLNNMTFRVKSDRRNLDMVYEVLLKLGIDLASPLKTRAVDGKTVYLVQKPRLIYLCLEENLSCEFVQKLAAQRPACIVFGEDCFKSAAHMRNATLILQNHQVAIKLI